MEVIGWYFMWQTSLIPTGPYIAEICVDEYQTLLTASVWVNVKPCRPLFWCGGYSISGELSGS